LIAPVACFRSIFFPERDELFSFKAGIPVVRKIELTVITSARERFVISESKALE
jgi:hypothetical protein